MITAILLSWKRPENVRKIIDALHSWDKVTEVIVWNNGSPTSFHGATTINSGRNFVFLPRYLMVPAARNHLVMIQDDDLLLTAEQLRKVYARLQDDRITGIRGRNLRADGSMGPVKHGEVDLICGNFSMFSRRLYNRAWPEMLEYMTPGNDLVEDDVAFSLAATAATDRRHFAVNVEPVTNLGTHDANSTHLARPYGPSRERAIKYWKRA